MKNLALSVFGYYKLYRTFKKQNKAYRAFGYVVTVLGLVYCALLLFPPLLFAHELSHKNFSVHSRQPLNEDIKRVLDKAESRLLRSPIYKSDSTRQIILADSFGLYKLMTAEGSSLGSTIPIIGLSRINRSDIGNDLVFRDTAPPNSRTLSGVIAHEVMHNQIREHLGIAKYYQLEAWKDEGYCEYIADETTLSFDEGLRRWRESPADSSGYAYFRYHRMVKYLLDEQGVTVEQLLSQTFDEKAVADAALASIRR